MRLYIGNKNYSSWSLRAWLPMRHFEVEFEEELVLLDTPSSKKEIGARSPSSRVPCLADGDVRVWDSLAIVEYVAETFPDKPFWPKDKVMRATARAIAAEMHAGFQALRNEMPMNVRAQGRKVNASAAAQADIARIKEMWAELLARPRSGPFFFGAFSIADAFYAPVVTRFRTYGVPLDGAARAWADAILAVPAMAEWVVAAEKEPWTTASEAIG
jgi:glutathione S-transferase